MLLYAASLGTYSGSMCAEKSVVFGAELSTVSFVALTNKYAANATSHAVSPAEAESKIQAGPLGKKLKFSNLPSVANMIASTAIVDKKMAIAKHMFDVAIFLDIENSVVSNIGVQP